MTTVRTWEDLQAASGDVVAALNRDERLACAAAVNPFLALQELGYEIEEQARPSIADRLRFTPKVAARRARLREQIAKLVGRSFDPDAGQLGELLYRELGLRPYPDERGCYPAPPDTWPPGKRLEYEPRDPLQALEGRHPVIALLLKYRKLGAAAWPFAPPEVYHAIRSGKVDTMVRRPRIRFKRTADGGNAGNG